MIIKFLAKQYNIEMSELKDKTIGELKAKIKEMIPQCSKLSNDKIMLFYKKAKITSADDVSLEDKEVGFTDDSTIFVVVVSSEAPKTEEPKKTETSHRPKVEGTHSQPPFGMGASAGLDTNMIEQMLSNPEMMNAAIDMAMPNATPEQKQMFRESAEAMRKNPEMMKQVMAGMNQGGLGMNPMMPGQNMYPPMMGNPMMGSPMMGTPNMHSPMMGSPMMGTPNMHSPMYNPGYYPYNPMFNPYMAQQQAPPNGPCSHGFYPPKMVDGKPEPQNAEEIYADKLNSLADMGFHDKDLNLKALVKSHGDISEAIEIITKEMNKYDN